MTKYTTLCILALALTTFGCAQGGEDCELLATDAAVPLEGCFPEDPCCEADSRLSPAGAPCGTGRGELTCLELGGAHQTRTFPTCSGTSALCDGPVLVLPRERAQCIEGYECDYDGPDCRWIGPGGNDN